MCFGNLQHKLLKRYFLAGEEGCEREHTIYLLTKHGTLQDETKFLASVTQASLKFPLTEQITELLLDLV